MTATTLAACVSTAKYLAEIVGWMLVGALFSAYFCPQLALFFVLVGR